MRVLKFVLMVCGIMVIAQGIQAQCAAGLCHWNVDVTVKEKVIRQRVIMRGGVEVNEPWKDAHGNVIAHVSPIEVNENGMTLSDNAVEIKHGAVKSKTVIKSKKKYRRICTGHGCYFIPVIESQETVKGQENQADAIPGIKQSGAE